MSNAKFFYKVIPFFLTASILFTACDVPDISDFTKQSAEMTSGIRKGVKDTESVLRNASDRDDLFGGQARTKIKADLASYKKAVGPTLKTLDALDGYLEALNALAQANKKSGDNAKGLVDSVSSLVTSVSEIQLAETGLNIASGLVALAEQFRTAKDFKTRVDLAALIVEGNQDKVLNSKTGKTERQCQYAEVKELSAKSDAASKKRYAELGCGVIDLLKFNIVDLSEINDDVSTWMINGVHDKNTVVLGLYESIVDNDLNTQKEYERLLDIKSLATLIKQLENDQAVPSKIVERKITLKNTLDSLFILDSQIKVDVLKKIGSCDNDNSCARMKEYIETFVCETDACEQQITQLITGISKTPFDNGIGIIEPILEARTVELQKQNQLYLAELDRITPAHTAALNDLKAIQDQQNRLKELLSSGADALDTWAATHANLRVALNTKKPLTVAALAAKVKELWLIVNPQKVEIK